MDCYLTDEIFNKENTCIILNQNSISLNSYGRCLDMANKYNYSDVAGMRKQDKTWRFYARPEDRDEEGACILKNPPHYTSGPVVCTLITQYGIGRPVEENNVAAKVIKASPNTDLSRRLSRDSQERRIYLFKHALSKLSFHLSSSRYTQVKNLIIPVGIGRAGKADKVWLEKYLPIIHAFSLEMEKIGKKTILTLTERVRQLLDEEFKNSSDDSVHYTNLLFYLPIINKDQFECKKKTSVNQQVDDEIWENEEDLPDTEPYF